MEDKANMQKSKWHEVWEKRTENKETLAGGTPQR